MKSLLIKNGTVVTGAGMTESDILIRDGKIIEISDRGKIEDPEASLSEVYDALGKWVLPGLVEPHMHIAAPLGGIIDIMDFKSASKVAAYGGVTSFMDFSSTLPGMSIRAAVRERLKEMSEGKQDYSCHAKVVSLVSPMTAAKLAIVNAELFDAKRKRDALIAEKASSEKMDKINAECTRLSENAEQMAFIAQAEIDARMDEIPKLVREDKIPTFKLFMTYRKAHVMIDDTDMLKVMKKITEAGGRVGFHAESNPIAEFNDEMFAKEGRLSPKGFSESKPNVCEAEAVNRVLTFAEMIKAKIYFFHITTKESVDLIRKAKARGVDVIADSGRLFMMSPPLRSQADSEALWEGILDGTISIVSSDNCTFTIKQKTTSDDYRKIISGTSGLGERLGLLLGEGVAKGRISLPQLVKVACENPAKIFGIYPKKGCLQPGSDADITVIDPRLSHELTCENLHYPESLTYSIYKDFYSHGWPVLVLRRGECLLSAGQFHEEASKGEFLSRIL